MTGVPYVLSARVFAPDGTLLVVHELTITARYVRSVNGGRPT